MPEEKTLRTKRRLLEAIPARRRRIYGLLVACIVTLACLKPGAVLAICAYQRFISPHKGYQCAHGALYGGPSCSEFGRRAIQEYGLVGGLLLLIDPQKANATYVCRGRTVPT